MYGAAVSSVDEMLSGLPDITIAQLLQRLVAGAVVLAVYGFAATRAVQAAGDDGPKHDGRLTLNPIPHLDVVGLLAMVFFRAGWMRPLAIDTSVYRRPRQGGLVTMAVATLALVALAVLAVAARRIVLQLLTFEVGLTVSTVLATVGDVAIGTAVLGLLPIPPLLGGMWWSVVRPGSERLAANPRVVLFGYVVLALVLLSGVLAPVTRTLASALMRLFGI